MTIPPYERGYSFAGYQASSPGKPLPGPKLDIELNGISTTMNQIVTRINGVIRSDGQLAVGAVTYDALTPGLQQLLIGQDAAELVQEILDDDTILRATGAVPMQGSLDMSDNEIRNLAAPTAPTAAATKLYVDSGIEAATTVLPPGTGAVVRQLKDKVKERVSLLDYGAVGDGVADDTVAVQRALNSGARTVEVPQGKIFKLTAKLTVSNRLTLEGNGELRWVAGIANGPALEVTADGVALNRLNMTNPNKLGARTGSAQFGIYFSANEGSVVSCQLRNFQTGVAVSAYGEFTKFVISDNQILDCIASGDGPSDPVSIKGEDRGDGIVVWGAICSITGNVVTAEAGGDSRIGIHVEALDPFVPTPGPYPGALAAVSGNTVTGPFRRGLVFEGVRHGSITGNTVAGATWWGICAAATKGCSISGNAILYDRPSSNQSGAAWAPLYGGIILNLDCAQTSVNGNVITVAAGGYAVGGILVTGQPSLRGVGNVLAGNIIHFEGTANNNSSGVYATYQDGIVVGHNSIMNVQLGLYTFDVTSPKIDGNKIAIIKVTGSNATRGVLINGAPNVNVSQNSIRGADVGTYVTNFDGGIVAGNYAEDCAIAGDFFGSSRFGVYNNVAVDCAQGWLNLGANNANNVSL